MSNKLVLSTTLISSLEKTSLDQIAVATIPIVIEVFYKTDVLKILQNFQGITWINYLMKLHVFSLLHATLNSTFNLILLYFVKFQIKAVKFQVVI